MYLSHQPFSIVALWVPGVGSLVSRVFYGIVDRVDGAFNSGIWATVYPFLLHLLASAHDPGGEIFGFSIN